MRIQGMKDRLENATHDPSQPTPSLPGNIHKETFFYGKVIKKNQNDPDLVGKIRIKENNSGHTSYHDVSLCSYKINAAYVVDKRWTNGSYMYLPLSIEVQRKCFRTVTTVMVPSDDSDGFGYFPMILDWESSFLAPVVFYSNHTERRKMESEPTDYTFMRLAIERKTSTKGNEYLQPVEFECFESSTPYPVDYKACLDRHINSLKKNYMETFGHPMED